VLPLPENKFDSDITGTKTPLIAEAFDGYIVLFYWIT
jgi:hypothetical protein